jgi:Cys-tRNA(Pro)/Cys-tRNA(Cys) deacylase
MKKPNKTNAMRILDSLNIEYEYFEYIIDDGKIDGISVADKIGEKRDIVFKTLVTVGADKELYVFVIPVEFELDLKKAAKASSQKNICMLLQKQLTKNTGYVHGGCSPIGMKKQFKTFIDETAMLNEKIIVSAGQVGLQIKLNPKDLGKCINSEFADLI